MTLGRTADNKIKIKTDGSAGLRAVGCACCGPPLPFFACCDCPAVMGDWGFSVTGGPIPFNYENQNETIVDDCGEGAEPRVCFDIFNAYGFGTPTPIGSEPFSFAFADFARSGADLASCGWDLRFEAGFYLFETATIKGPNGEIDYIYDNQFSGQTVNEIFINNPVGTYDVFVDGDPSTSQVPEGWTLIAPTPRQYKYTFVITKIT